MLEEKIYKNYVEALKAKDRHKTDFLSLIRAELKNQAIDLKKEKLEDEEVLAVLKKQQKRLQDAKECISSSPRQDLIQNLERELNILSEYLPEPLCEEELIKIIEEAISQTSASSMKDMGKVMKEVLAKVGARADSKAVSQLVKSKLSSI
jgi:uncharacterized protein YqeY